MDVRLTARVEDEGGHAEIAWTFRAVDERDAIREFLSKMVTVNDRRAVDFLTWDSTKKRYNL